MAFLIHPLPPIPVYVRKEYLYDLEKGHGEYTPGIWIAVKSVQYKALYFETLLTEYGALYDKLPISAFVSNPMTPELDLELHNLQFWNCMDYGVRAIYKQFIGSMDFEIFTRDHQILKATYVFTLDNYHPDCDVIDYSTSEIPEEHKSFNILELENGQYAAYPNNRMRVYDNSLTPKNPKMPDFKVSTRCYQVENGYSYRLGDTDEYFWKIPEEEKC